MRLFISTFILITYFFKDLFEFLNYCILDEDEEDDQVYYEAV
jgi:hypothetical protein